jgi:hypothetical protein
MGSAQLFPYGHCNVQSGRTQWFLRLVAWQCLGIGSDRSQLHKLIRAQDIIVDENDTLDRLQALV